MRRVAARKKKEGGKEEKLFLVRSFSTCAKFGKVGEKVTQTINV